MLWKNIKDKYKKWSKNEYGYHVSLDNFWIKVGDGAEVGDWAKVGDGAEVGDWAKVGKQLTYIVGSMNQVYLYDPKKKMIGIGCEVHTIEAWLSDYKKIGAANGYTHNQIKEYKRYIDLFAESLK